MVATRHGTAVPAQGATRIENGKLSSENSAVGNLARALSPSPSSRQKSCLDWLIFPEWTRTASPARAAFWAGARSQQGLRRPSGLGEGRGATPMARTCLEVGASTVQARVTRSHRGQARRWRSRCNPRVGGVGSRPLLSRDAALGSDRRDSRASGSPRTGPGVVTYRA